METLARATVSMTEAEVFQLERKRSGYHREADYLRIITQKTASFMSACCRIGGLLGARPTRAGRGPDPLRARHRHRVPDQRRLARLRRRPGPARQGGRRRPAGGQAHAAAHRHARARATRRRPSGSGPCCAAARSDRGDRGDSPAGAGGRGRRVRARARAQAYARAAKAALGSLRAVRGAGDAVAGRGLRRRSRSVSAAARPPRVWPESSR